MKNASLVAAAAALFATACGPCYSEHTDRVVTVPSEAEAPPDADLVIQLAVEECGHAIGASLEWVYGLPRGQTGYAAWGDEACGSYIWVHVPRPIPGTSFPAYRSALAHELYHACTRDEDDAPARAFADRVNARAERIVEQGATE